LPLPAPHVGDLLRQEQLALAGAQRVIRLAALGDVLEDRENTGIAAEVAQYDRDDDRASPAVSMVHHRFDLGNAAGSAQPAAEGRPPRRGPDRGGPARAQAVWRRERPVALPQRIHLHVAHDDGLTAERRGAARARARPDLEPVYGGVVRGGQRGRGTVTQPPALAVQEENRAEHAGSGALDQRDDGIEAFGQRGPAGDALEDVG